MLHVKLHAIAVVTWSVMQMLGEAFREEVVANGGRLPAFSLSTIADIASRLWLMARAWNGRKNPQVSA